MIRALDMCIDKLPADAPPEIFLDIANKYREANQPDKMLLVIQKYLQRKPKDWSAWLDLGLVNMGLGRTNEAIKALNEAIKVGGPEARDTVAKDPRFEPIRNGINNRAMDHMIGLPTSIPLN
jgi:tetratricopeptide (TPR) repeat protein